jgi:HD-GYP domain-containing protein (c-di-GMP phosphodiesterase class II)
LVSRPLITGDGDSIPLRLSFGVATYPGDAVSPGQLIAAADTSLYASKQRGGDTITSADTEDEPRTEAAGLRGMASRLMNLLGAKDHFTRRQSDQAVMHALFLGGLLNLPETSLETLRLAAMLHDVGKLGVEDTILRKPGPLNRDEERTLRRHVEVGEAIIRDLPRVAEVLEVVRAHHERHDGNGYPAGLSGSDIPLLARILAIADAYSAMTVDRPYRRRLTGEQAKAELLRVAGAQLDPELVARFLQNLPEEKSAQAVAS